MAKSIIEEQDSHVTSRRTLFDHEKQILRGNIAAFRSSECAEKKKEKKVHSFRIGEAVDDTPSLPQKNDSSFFFLKFTSDGP